MSASMEPIRRVFFCLDALTGLHRNSDSAGPDWAWRGGASGCRTRPGLVLSRHACIPGWNADPNIKNERLLNATLQLPEESGAATAVCSDASLLAWGFLVSAAPRQVMRSRSVQHAQMSRHALMSVPPLLACLKQQFWASLSTPIRSLSWSARKPSGRPEAASTRYALREVAFTFWC